MCTKIMVCYGDGIKNANVPQSEVIEKENDCEPGQYYITKDGKYAIPVEHAVMKDGEIDLEITPKIDLSRLRGPAGELEPN